MLLSAGSAVAVETSSTTVISPESSSLTLPRHLTGPRLLSFGSSVGIFPRIFPNQPHALPPLLQPSTPACNPPTNATTSVPPHTPLPRQPTAPCNFLQGSNPPCGSTSLPLPGSSPRSKNPPREEEFQTTSRFEDDPHEGRLDSRVAQHERGSLSGKCISRAGCGSASGMMPTGCGRGASPVSEIIRWLDTFPVMVP